MAEEDDLREHLGKEVYELFDASREFIVKDHIKNFVCFQYPFEINRLRSALAAVVRNAKKENPDQK